MILMFSSQKRKSSAKWTEKVISSNKALDEMKFDEVENDLCDVLSSITVKKLIPQDLDVFLNKSGYDGINGTLLRGSDCC
jgi:hypothetical protein